MLYYEVSLNWGVVTFRYYVAFFIYSLPAKYIDPLTCVPYHNSHCFRMIREAYYQQLEGRGDRSNIHLDEWLRWYNRNKDKIKKNFRQFKVPLLDS